MDRKLLTQPSLAAVPSLALGHTQNCWLSELLNKRVMILFPCVTYATFRIQISPPDLMPLF